MSIADLTDPRSIPRELMALIPQLQSVPSAHYCPGVKENGRCSTTLSRRIQVIEPFYYIDDEMLLKASTIRHNRARRAEGTLNSPVAEYRYH